MSSFFDDLMVGLNEAVAIEKGELTGKRKVYEIQPVKKYDNDSLYVIGGARVYAELLDYCDTAYITRFYTSFDNADAFIENFDALEGWKLEKQSAIMEEKGIKYSFCTYVKVKEGNN